MSTSKFSITQPSHGSLELSHRSTSPSEGMLEEALSLSRARSLLLKEPSSSTRRKRVRLLLPIPEEVKYIPPSPTTLEKLYDTFVSKPVPKKQRISFKEPQPIVAITLGKYGLQETFQVYRVFLCHCSPVFTILLANNKASLSLERFTPHVFGLFVHWLYHQEVYDETSNEKFPGYIVLMDLWVLGNEFGVVELKNAVLDVMVARDDRVKILPDHVLLHLAWETVPHNSSFMRMIIDWFVLRVHMDSVHEALEKFPRGLLERITVAAMLSPIRGSANVVGLIRRPAKYYREKVVSK